MVDEIEKDRDLLKSAQVLCETMRRGRPFKKTIRQACYSYKLETTASRPVSLFGSLKDIFAKVEPQAIPHLALPH